MDILKRRCYYCGKNPCECVDETANDNQRKNLEQQELDLEDIRTDKKGVLVAGALLGGKDEDE